MEILIWTLNFPTRKYLDYMQIYMMLLEQFNHILAKDLATVLWLDKVEINSCLIMWLGYLFCFYVKIFVPSIFDSNDFWSSMSCNMVLDIGLGDRKITKRLGVFLDEKVQGCLFWPPKKQKPTKYTFGCTKNLHGIVWNCGSLDYSELPNCLPKNVKVEFFARGWEKWKTLRDLFGKDVENLDGHGFPKFQNLIINPKTEDETWICTNYPFSYKNILHCAERMASVLSVWTMQHFRL